MAPSLVGDAPGSEDDSALLIVGHGCVECCCDVFGRRSTARVDGDGDVREQLGDLLLFYPDRRETGSAIAVTSEPLAQVPDGLADHPTGAQLCALFVLIAGPWTELLNVLATSITTRARSASSSCLLGKRIARSGPTEPLMSRKITKPTEGSGTRPVSTDFAIHARKLSP